MTRDEFIQKAISRGLNDPEKLKLALNDYRVEVGAFEDDSATGVEPEPEVEETVVSPEQQEVSTPPKERYIDRIMSYWTDDIPEEVGGLMERTEQRKDRVFEPTVLGESAVEKTGAEGIAAGAVRSIAGTPERIGRVAGGIAGTVGEVPGVVMSLGIKAADNLTAGAVDKVINSVGKAVVEAGPIKNLIKWWNGLPDADKANYAATVDMTEALGWKVGKKAADVIEGAGKATKKTGVGFLGGELKIKKALAERGYGNRIDIKKQNILDNVAKYDLESTTGNFNKMATKAETMASQRVKKADAILEGIANSPNAPKEQFVDDIIMNAYENIDQISDLGDRSAATNVLDNILKDAGAESLTGNKGLPELIKFKRALDKKGKLFVHGPFKSDSDNLRAAIKKKLYLDAVGKIRKISPDAADLNKEAKELFDISAVSGDAVARIANKDQAFTFSDKMIGGAASIGAVTALANQDPSLAIKTLLIGLATSGASKVAGQGRGAAAIIKTGKKIQSAGKGLKRSDLLPAATVGAISDATKTIHGIPAYDEE